MTLQPHEISFSAASVQILGLAVPQGGKTGERSPADKMADKLLEAAEKAKSPVVAEKVSDLAGLIRDGQPADKVYEAIADARGAVKSSGGDFNTTRALLDASKYESGKAVSGGSQQELAVNDTIGAALAAATQKYGSPSPVQDEGVSKQVLVAMAKGPRQLS